MGHYEPLEYRKDEANQRDWVPEQESSRHYLRVIAYAENGIILELDGVNLGGVEKQVRKVGGGLQIGCTFVTKEAMEEMVKVWNS